MTKYPACQTLEVIKLHLDSGPKFTVSFQRRLMARLLMGVCKTEPGLMKNYYRKSKKLKGSEKLHKVGGGSERNSQELGEIFS